MPYDPAQLHRRSIRLPGRDDNGAYFITADRVKNEGDAGVAPTKEETLD